MALNFKQLTFEDAALLLKWRTSPEITRNMFTDLQAPSIEKQRQWINSLADREDYCAFMIQDDGHSVGFLCFTDIDSVNQRCSTGSYIYEREPRLKYGLTLHTYICNYAFHKLQCNKIVNYIMDANEKVVKLQILHKTQFIGIFKQHILKNGRFHDVHVFELLKSDWLTQKQHYSLITIRDAFDNWN